ncbi:acetyl-CoA acetyltransferase [Acinetobacter sp. Ac_877]|uniref:acetyl-CoA C-acetyltransferase n=1 Tax=Acinetobacter portensis TaxID=1839785 RepID=UPI00128E09E3|nr:acetyl-CoA C-acetyltransferase [Acinetobacter portensis]MPW40180.1 acetyl-CoA acetyltransferase [Acinetobacter portensis]
MSINKVYICDAIRTPIGRFGGVFKNLSPLDLAVPLIQHLVSKNSEIPKYLDELIVGQGYGTPEAANIGKALALDAELPDHVCGYTVDRRCASGLQAIIDATMMIQTGKANLIIAGGAESLSQAPFYSSKIRWGSFGDLTLKDSLKYGRIYANGQKNPILGGMLETAENLRREYQISRQEQDELAYQSHMKACKAIEQGKFKKEILPISVKGRLIEQDEHPRQDTTLEQLAKLKPILEKDDAEATVTAGNSSGQNDAAAFCLIASEEMANQLGLQPIAEIIDWAVAGVPSAVMGIGPVPAIQKVLKNTGLSLSDIDRIEINEAFAVQLIACTKALNFSERELQKLNVNGSGISLGHPIGATGARIMTTLINELNSTSSHYGLISMCIGGGQGMAAIIKSINH